MNMDRREAIKKVSGAAAVAVMGGSAAAAIDAPGVIDSAQKSGRLVEAVVAASRFGKMCVANDCALPESVSIILLKDDGTESDDSWCRACALNGHVRKTAVIPVNTGMDNMSGSEILSPLEIAAGYSGNGFIGTVKVEVDFTQTEYPCGSMAILARVHAMYSHLLGATRVQAHRIHHKMVWKDEDWPEEMGHSILANLKRVIKEERGFEILPKLAIA